MELLTVEDFKNARFDPNWTPFDYLLEVARVGQEKLQKQEKKSHASGFLKRYNAPQPHGRAMCKEEDMSFKQGKSLNKSAAGLKRKRQFKEEDEESEGLKLKRNKKEKPVCPNPPPDLPDNFKQHIVEKMGGSDWVLVIQKPIFSSDVKRRASRFSMPFSQLETHEFLTTTEVELLEDHKAIQVCLLEPSLKETDITFKRWKMNKSLMYVLRSPWNSVVESNGLEVDDIVQLWSFRVDTSLCFALVKVPSSNEELDQKNKEYAGHKASIVEVIKKSI